MSESEAEATPQPLWKNLRVIHLLIIALAAETGYAVLNISTMPVYLKETRHLGGTSIGFVLMAYLLSEALFKSPMGHLADRYGRKRLMTIGPALTIFTSLCSIIVPFRPQPVEILLFIILRIFDGIGAAMLWPGAFAEMGDSVTDGQRQQAMSLLNMCYLLGVALALPLGGLVETLAHNAASLILAAALFCGVSFAAWKFLPSDSTYAHQGRVEGEGAAMVEIFRTAREIPTYLLLAVIMFIGIGFPIPIIKIFALEEFHMNGWTFGILVFGATIPMALFSVPMAKFGDRIGRERAAHLGMGLCAGGLLFICIGAFVGLFRSAWAMALGGMPVGIGFLLAIPAWMASVSDTNPSKRAANLGAVMAAQGIGAIIGVPLGGLCYEKLQVFGSDFGRYSPFLGCAACVTAGWLISLRVLRSPA